MKPQAKETTEEKRFRAKSLACRIAESNNIDPAVIRTMIDSQYNRRCFVVMENSTHATIIYDDDPDVRFIINNHPGRLQEISNGKER